MDPRVPREWAESVWAALAAQKDELLASGDRGQVAQALLADAALDHALVGCLLGRPAAEVRAGLLEAGRALVAVDLLRGTSASVPVLLVEDEGVSVTAPVVDDSLSSPDRARLAHHLAGLTNDRELLGVTRWPGGPDPEERALAALRSGHAGAFLAALAEVLEPHGAPVHDPRELLSVPALALSSRALAAALVTADALPEHAALPVRLLVRDDAAPPVPT